MAPSMRMAVVAIVAAAVAAVPTPPDVDARLDALTHQLGSKTVSSAGTPVVVSPTAGNTVVTRKNFLSLTTSQQTKFLHAIEKMQEPGYGGPFATSEILHGLRFLHAQTRDGRPYANERLPLSMLRVQAA